MLFGTLGFGVYGSMLKFQGLGLCQAVGEKVVWGGAVGVWSVQGAPEQTLKQHYIVEISQFILPKL